MVDFDLRTLSRKILLIVAILSFLVIAEMILVSAEEPAAAAPNSSPHAAYEWAPSGPASVNASSGPVSS
jgi:hypothetical protein